MALMAREIVSWDTLSCSPITACGMLWCTWISITFRHSSAPCSAVPLDPLLAQTDEQIGELGRGQPHGISHDDGPFLMSLLTMFHQPSYLMGADIIISFPGNATRHPLNKLSSCLISGGSGVLTGVARPGR